MAKLAVQSVKFKKDYMMGLAFLLFFLIVASECFLAFWLPWHLKLDSMWAEQVIRQELIDHFDTVRWRSRRASEKQPKPVSSEAAIICRSLDKAAAFMHKYGKELTPQQCNEFIGIILKLNTPSALLYNGKSYSKVIELDSRRYLQTLRGVKVENKSKK
ncbi:MAG: hypothetical protein E7052_11385 [Lentisphaerae bacterium]|nr:hypothetical protein [Lentisphaerota bacterium]